MELSVLLDILPGKAAIEKWSRPIKKYNCALIFLQKRHPYQIMKEVGRVVSLIYISLIHSAFKKSTSFLHL